MAEDITKLPKWAQQKITSLENTVEYQAAKLSQGPEDSNTFADPYADNPRPLGKDTKIEFQLDGFSEAKSHWKRLQVSADRDHHGRPFINVYGGDSIHICPESSNTCRIYIMEKV